MRGLYLLHFDPPYRHARHYLGFAEDIRARVHEHVAGGSKASPLVKAATAAGSKVTLTRAWEGEGRKRERAIKVQGGHARKCPTCRTLGIGQRASRAYMHPTPHKPRHRARAAVSHAHALELPGSLEPA